MDPQAPPPPPPPPPLPQPAPAPAPLAAPAASAQTNTMAVVSLATGIASWFLLPVVGAVVAIVTGHMAKREIRQTGEQGDSFATIGLLLGYLHLAVVALVILVLVLVFAGVAAAILGSGASAH